MTTLTVPKSKFKPKAFEYLRRVEKEHLRVCVTDHGRPVADIVPHRAGDDDALKALRGLVREYHDPTAPVHVEWEADL